MTKFRVPVLSFPDFMDIFSVQRVFWGKNVQMLPCFEENKILKKVAIFRVSVLGGSQNKVGSLKFLFFWLISSQIWLIRLADDHQNKFEGGNPQIEGKKTLVGLHHMDD
jgi:hypothetical protein